jgi:hypothetical protein
MGRNASCACKWHSSAPEREEKGDEREQGGGERGLEGKGADVGGPVAPEEGAVVVR